MNLQGLWGSLIKPRSLNVHPDTKLFCGCLGFFPYLLLFQLTGTKTHQVKPGNPWNPLAGFTICVRTGINLPPFFQPRWLISRSDSKPCLKYLAAQSIPSSHFIICTLTQFDRTDFIEATIDYLVCPWSVCSLGAAGRLDGVSHFKVLWIIT